MNLQQQEQFYQVMSRLRGNSRAASTKDSRVTEMTNGLLVSKPVNKEPEIIDLQEYAKSHNVSNAASAPSEQTKRDSLFHKV